MITQTRLNEKNFKLIAKNWEKGIDKEFTSSDLVLNMAMLLPWNDDRKPTLGALKDFDKEDSFYVARSMEGQNTYVSTIQSLNNLSELAKKKFLTVYRFPVKDIGTTDILELKNHEIENKDITKIVFNFTGNSITAIDPSETFQLYEEKIGKGKEKIVYIAIPRPGEIGSNVRQNAISVKNYLDVLSQAVNFMVSRYPQASIDFVTHSLGTALGVGVLKDNPSLKVENLVINRGLAGETTFLKNNSNSILNIVGKINEKTKLSKLNTINWLKKIIDKKNQSKGFGDLKNIVIFDGEKDTLLPKHGKKMYQTIIDADNKNKINANLFNIKKLGHNNDLPHDFLKSHIDQIADDKYQGHKRYTVTPAEYSYTEQEDNIEQSNMLNEKK